MFERQTGNDLLPKNELLVQYSSLYCGTRQETKILIDNLLEEIYQYQQMLFIQNWQNEITKAISLMLEAHANQKPRPDGTPYVEHPIAVAMSVFTQRKAKDKDVTIAALLHDVVEDQENLVAQKLPDAKGQDSVKALHFIEQNFGKRVATLVAALTNPDFKAMCTARGIEPSRKNTNPLYAERVKEVIEDPDVALIKYYDFASNAFRLNEIPDLKRRRELAEKYKPVFEHFIKRFSDTTNPINISEETRLKIIADLKQKYNEVVEFLASQPDPQS